MYLHSLKKEVSVFPHCIPMLWIRTSLYSRIVHNAPWNLNNYTNAPWIGELCVLPALDVTVAINTWVLLFISVWGSMMSRYSTIAYMTWIILQSVMMMIVPNSHVRKQRNEKGEVNGEYGTIWGEEEGNSNYGGMLYRMYNQCKGLWRHLEL